MSDLILDLWVSGRPRTKGSMRHVGGGRMMQSVVGSTEWARVIRDAVRQHIDRGLAGRAGRGRAVKVRGLFFLRPKRGPQENEIAPIWVGAGDSDKLERNGLDALQDDPKRGYVGVMADDVQVVSLSSEKVIADRGWPVGVHIQVWALSAEEVLMQSTAAHREAWQAMRKATVPE